MTTSEHRWTDGDNLIAYHLYRFGGDSLPATKPEVAETLGMSLASLDKKIANFKALDGRGGLTSYSSRAEHIHELYSAVADAEVTEAATRAWILAMETQIERLKYELAKRRQ